MHLRNNDRGFTLIELLISIVILGVIAFPLGNVIIAYLRNTDAVTARLSESHDAQISAAFFAQDVASIGTRAATSPYALNQSVELGVAYNGGAYPCGVAGTPNALVRFAWDDYAGTGAATVVRVAYVVEVASGQRQLHRIRCAGSSTPTNDTVIVHDLDPATTPTVTCSTTCTAAPAIPASVTLTLALRNPKDTGSAYTVALAGQRRQT